MEPERESSAASPWLPELETLHRNLQELDLSLANMRSRPEEKTIDNLKKISEDFLRIRTNIDMVVNMYHMQMPELERLIPVKEVYEIISRASLGTLDDFEKDLYELINNNLDVIGFIMPEPLPPSAPLLSYARPPKEYDIVDALSDANRIAPPRDKRAREKPLSGIGVKKSKPEDERASDDRPLDYSESKPNSFR